MIDQARREVREFLESFSKLADRWIFKKPYDGLEDDFVKEIESVSHIDKCFAKYLTMCLLEYLENRGKKWRGGIWK